MAVLIDVVFVALFLFAVIRHFRLGLACSVLSAGKFIFSILCASLLAKPVALLLGYAFDALLTDDGAVGILAGILGFAVSFVAVFLLSGLIIRALSKIKIPIITRVDKLLGLCLGIVIGALSLSVLAVAVYSLAEIVSFIDSGSGAMDIYHDSYVFRFVYDLKLFDFIRNLI